MIETAPVSSHAAIIPVGKEWVQGECRPNYRPVSNQGRSWRKQMVRFRASSEKADRQVDCLSGRFRPKSDAGRTIGHSRNRTLPAIWRRRLRAQTGLPASRAIAESENRRNSVRRPGMMVGNGSESRVSQSNTVACRSEISTAQSIFVPSRGLTSIVMTRAADRHRYHTLRQ